MRVQHPRSRLVAAYACLVALSYLIHSLPGLPYYRSSGEYGFWVVIDIVLVILIARGSRVAIAVPFTLNALGFLVIVVLTTGPLAAGVVAYLLVKAMETIVLVLLWRHADVASPRGTTPAAFARR